MIQLLIVIVVVVVVKIVVVVVIIVVVVVVRFTERLLSFYVLNRYRCYSLESHLCLNRSIWTPVGQTAHKCHRSNVLWRSYRLWQKGNGFHWQEIADVPVSIHALSTAGYYHN